MNQRVFTFNYELKDNQGQVLDSSHADGPLAFLEGAKQIIPMLEKQILDLTPGQKKNVKLKAAEAYGIQDPKMLMDVPKKELEHLKYELGTFIQLELVDQMKLVRVVKITDENITLDGNHPLAGMDLEFNIEMMTVRPATAEEIAHGHAHGQGGHHHH